MGGGIGEWGGGVASGYMPYIIPFYNPLEGSHIIRFSSPSSVGRTEMRMEELYAPLADTYILDDFKTGPMALTPD